MTRNEFNIIFRDDPAFGDWEIRLITSEPKTEEEIESLIWYQIEIASRSLPVYTPVDIMDDLCDSHNGWHWEDMDYNAIVIDHWSADSESEEFE